MNEEVEDLKKRLDAAERKTAIWRSQVMVFLALLVAGVVISLGWTLFSLVARVEKAEKALTAKQKVVMAERFVLVDEKGRERGTIATAKETGDASLKFWDEKGTNHAMYASDALAFFDRRGAETVRLQGQEDSTWLGLVAGDGTLFFVAGEGKGERGVWAENLTNGPYPLEEAAKAKGPRAEVLQK